MTRNLAPLVAVMILVGCTGTLVSPDDKPASGPGGSASGTGPGTGTSSTSASAPGAPAPAGTVLLASAARRLSRRELQQTVLDLTGVDLGNDLTNLPEDWSEATETFAFDNAYGLQQPSPALIETVNTLAGIVGDKLLSTPTVKSKVVPCTPTGPSDLACFRTFVTTFGRRALRRPLDPAEVDQIVTKVQPYSMEANDFFFGVSLAVRAFLEDPEFLYRIEIGQPVASMPGVLKLGGYEMAARLAYFLWGTTPDDALLDMAGTGEKLQTVGHIMAAANRMLADRRAVTMVDRFNAMWLGYERQPPPPTLLKAMMDETNNLIERVVFKEKRSVLDLFRLGETYVDATLAANYGLPRPPGSGSNWVPYGTTGRQGILSHGTVLGVERKHTDTSPTMRGLFLRTRVMCQKIPQPPADLMVDTDDPGLAGPRCKTQRYAMWSQPGCSTCHTMLDPIGHGLENYDRVGKARTVAPQDLTDGKPDCTITGEGFLDTPSNAFKGVAQLSDKLLSSGIVEKCLTRQVASFYLGRDIRDPERKLFEEEVGGRFQKNNFRFDQLLVDLVTLPGFGYRLSE